MGTGRIRILGDFLMNSIKNKRRNGIELLILFLCLFLFSVPALSQNPQGDPDPYIPGEEIFWQHTGGHEVILGTQAIVDGDGYMVAGQLWDSIKPVNTLRPQNNWIFMNIGYGHILNWTEPVHMWPGGWTHTLIWRNGKRFLGSVFSTDENFNPATINGEANPHHDATSGPQYSLLRYTDQLPGANDPNRNYKRNAYWADPDRRTQKVYEAGFPTTVGIDVRIKARQFTRNFAGLNDFMIVELTLENTGVVDINGDGNINKTGNKIDAVALAVQALPGISVEVGDAGGRRGNRFGAARMIGYVADEDNTGAPWDMLVTYAGPQEIFLGEWEITDPEKKNFGVIDHANRGYTDVWAGWNWLGVKQGNSSDFNAPDKETLFGTHPIGEGAERGWYRSVVDALGHFGFAPHQVFNVATGAWYANFGRDKNPDNANLAPNPNFFESGTEGDVTTFVPKASPGRPNGDTKYSSVDVSPTVGFQQKPFEPGFTKGFNHIEPFNGRMVDGLGPFSLEVGESITLVYVQYAGFRLPGVQQALQAARWAWERNWQLQTALPVPPTPHIKVEGTQDQVTRIRWDDIADAEADGYKIWRASQFKQIRYIDRGMRALSRYWKQHDASGSWENYLDPINPNFGGEEFAQPEDRGIYQPNSWGSYDLVAKIPKAELNQYRDPSGQYTYAWDDEESIVGFTYWYYVSAYKDGNFTGPGGRTTTHLETSNFNRNGADGFWHGTYPFSIRSPEFPTTAEGRARMGVAFRLEPPVASTDDLRAGRVEITVSPNPYKVASLTDVRDDPTSHNVDFLNLPANCTLTILDVSGQLIYQELIENAANGVWTWNMHSKNGVEVASGLYIYHVKYDGGEHLGHFAILR
jgi:hypothetical protein